MTTITKMTALTTEARSAIEVAITAGTDRKEIAKEHNCTPRVVGMVAMKLKAPAAQSPVVEETTSEESTEVLEPLNLKGRPANQSKLEKLAALKEEVGEIDAVEATTSKAKGTRSVRGLNDKDTRDLIVVKNDGSKMAWCTSKFNYKNSTDAFIKGKLEKRASNRKGELATQFTNLLAGELIIERTSIASAEADALTVAAYNELVEAGYEFCGKAPKGAPKKEKPVVEKAPQTAEEIQAEIDALIAKKAVFEKVPATTEVATDEEQATAATEEDLDEALLDAES
ncbi:coil containing protein [Vibrio phage 2.275.O._10N.286.54.E11]|nr:coil containing protein [Vibrio phage 2.275.O._10N.286.54.E11]